jgi:uncharacterized protein involved in exopolysaccharide biosynthesis
MAYLLMFLIGVVFGGMLGLLAAALAVAGRDDRR